MAEAPKLQLPEWVQDLLAAERQKGYQEGWEDGQRQLKHQIESLLKGVR